MPQQWHWQRQQRRGRFFFLLDCGRRGWEGGGEWAGARGGGSGGGGASSDRGRDGRRTGRVAAADAEQHGWYVHRRKHVVDSPQLPLLFVGMYIEVHIFSCTGWAVFYCFLFRASLSLTLSAVDFPAPL